MRAEFGAGGIRGAVCLVIGVALGAASYALGAAGDHPPIESMRFVLVDVGGALVGSFHPTGLNLGDDAVRHRPRVKSVTAVFGDQAVEPAGDQFQGLVPARFAKPVAFLDQWGLDAVLMVDEVVPPGRLMQRAFAVAADIGSSSESASTLLSPRSLRSRPGRSRSMRCA